MLLPFLHLFTPHHTNNHRARILHPAGLSVLVGVFLLAQSFLYLFESSGSLPAGLVLGYASSIIPEQVVEMTNAERAKEGLPPLTVSSALTQAANAKAGHMFQEDYWAHIAPNGTTPWYFIKNAGYSYSVAGENLARDFGDTASMVREWMNSPTHRENIMNAKYSQIGIAVVDGKLQGTETTLVVQMFGAPLQKAAAPQTSPKAAASEVTAPAVEQKPVALAAPTEIPEALQQPLLAQQEVVSESETTQKQLMPDTLGNTVLERQNQRPESSILISPLTITKTVGMSILALLILVLLYDTIVIHYKQIPRSVGKNWAHLTFFSIVLIIIIALGSGRII